MKNSKALDLVISVSVVLGIGLTLMPAVARIERTPAEAKCQSNLRMWAEAMTLYIADNNGTYPTNRSSEFSILNEIRLSDGIDANGNPIRFQYGANWVEALYPYLDQLAVKTGRSRETFLRCPNANNGTYPTGSTAAKVSYAFNGYLTEYHQGLVRNPEKVLMFREMDRLVNSVMRPAFNYTTTSRPKSAFLTTIDSAFSYTLNTNNKLHSDGSYVVFADGHVHYFTTDYYVYDSELVFDPQTNHWYNYSFSNPANDQERAYDKSIAITP